jgi:hypothetical protein
VAAQAASSPSTNRTGGRSEGVKDRASMKAA